MLLGYRLTFDFHLIWNICNWETLIPPVFIFNIIFKFPECQCPSAHVIQNKHPFSRVALELFWAHCSRDQAEPLQISMNHVFNSKKISRLEVSTSAAFEAIGTNKKDFVQGSAASRLYISLKPLRKFWRATYHESMVFNPNLKERLIRSSHWRMFKSNNQKCLVFIHNCSTYRHFYYNVRLVHSHFLYHKSHRDLLLAHSQLTNWRLRNEGEEQAANEQFSIS